jgi:hypothetical protein
MAPLASDKYSEAEDVCEIYDMDTMEDDDLEGRRVTDCGWVFKRMGLGLGLGLGRPSGFGAAAR